MSWYGYRPPTNFASWIIASFCGGFTGGILQQTLVPDSTAAFFASGVVGGGAGLWLVAALHGAKPESVFEGLIGITPIALGMSCYSSLPGAFAALLLFE